MSNRDTFIAVAKVLRKHAYRARERALRHYEFKRAADAPQPTDPVHFEIFSGVYSLFIDGTRTEVSHSVLDKFLDAYDPQS